VRFAGIDVASQIHVLAILDETGRVLLKPTSFSEDTTGYARLFDLLGAAADLLIAMEASGHYSKNLFATLTAKGFAVAVLNPLRTRRFAQEDLTRAKTDAVDALAIARFAAQKRPAPTPPPDPLTDTLRELVRFRDRLIKDFTSRLRQLHRLVDLGFPEFTRHVRTMDSRLATAVLHEYPTAQAFDRRCFVRLAGISHGRGHRVGKPLARQLIDTAATSVGRHHGPAYAAQVRYICEDLETLRHKIHELASQIDQALRDHKVGSLLTTIDGIGPPTAARLIATLGDPAHFRSAAALASYVGVVPGTNESGLRRPGRAPLTPIGHAHLRTALWMPTLAAIRKNPWLRAYYDRLRARGKPAKVAVTATLRKLLTVIYSVAKRQKPFVSPPFSPADPAPPQVQSWP